MFTNDRERTLGLFLAFLTVVAVPMPLSAQFGNGMGGLGGPGGGPGPGSAGPNLSGPQQNTFRDQVEGRAPVFSSTGEKTPVTDVRIRGNETVSDVAVQAYLKTKKGRAFDPEIVQGDVRRLTTSGKFRDVRTYTQRSPQGILVTFEVLERPSIREILFHGNRAISDKTLREQSGLEIGDALILYNVEEARRKVHEYYQSQGFAKARVFVAEGDKPQHRRVVLKVHEGVQQSIWSVRFVGNQYFRSDRLLTQVQSKPLMGQQVIPFFPKKLDPNLIADDVRSLTAYYRNLGFFNAKVGRELKYNSKGDWVDLIFVIDEGPRYKVRNITIAGNTKFDTESLRERLMLKGGDSFNLGEMQRDVNALRDIYGGNGYIFADIQPDTRFLEQPGELDLVYNISEGDLFRVGKINVHIRGEFPHTKQTVVLNRLSFRPGDVIDIREVRASERRLKSSQLFEANPAQGSVPKIVVRPPDATSLAQAKRRQAFYRGQSPDSSATNTTDVDIYLPAVKVADQVEQLIPWR